MSKTIVGAVIGYGGMGNFHAGKMQSVRGIKLAGVYDIDPAQNELARSRGIKAYASREELLADPKIDLVNEGNALLEILVNDILAYGTAAGEYKGHESMTKNYVGTDREIPATDVINTAYLSGYTVVFGQIGRAHV